MIVSMDKKYKTRSGLDVQIVRIYEKGPYTVEAIVTTEMGSNEFEAYTSDGSFYDDNLPSLLDLVEVK